jgi:hypothetical protein
MIMTSLQLTGRVAGYFWNHTAAALFESYTTAMMETTHE